MKKPYSTRSDLEKVLSNWTKTRGLFSRGEYSISIVRAATTAELAINYAIRQELNVNRKLPLEFVDKQLLDANGLRNKLDRLFVPIFAGTKHEIWAKDLRREFMKLNKQRNDIAHRGEFRKKETARDHLQLAERELQNLISKYEKPFKLDKFNPKATHTMTVMTPSGNVITMPAHAKEDECTSKNSHNTYEPPSSQGQ